MSTRQSTFKAVALISAISITHLPLTAVAQEAGDARSYSSAATKVAVKYGPKMVKQLRQTTKFSVPPSSLPAVERSQAVESTYAKYVERRSAYASAKNATEWLSLGAGGSAALVAALAGPQASVTIPALLVGTAITTIIDIGNEELDAAGRVELRKLLRSRQSSILKELGLDYDGFDQMSDPEAIRVAFSEGYAVFTDLRERAGGDDAVWKNTQEMIVDAIANTTKEQWDAIDANQDNIEHVTDFVVDLAVNLTEFQEEVDKRFQVLETGYENLSTSIGELQEAVVDLDNRVGALEKNQAVITDFIFDDMPPGRKVAALKSGLFGSRFECPPNQESCDASALKESLINRFSKEAEVQQLVSDVAFAVTSLNDIGKIALDLGIASPELQDAVRIGNAAAGAFTNFTAGNYLGAISSLTGLFAKKSDPDAERFKILMRYLDQQFKQINAKLDAILENQAKIMEALVGVSKQIQEGFQRTDRRLEAMQFELNRASSGVRALIWNDWKSCYAVYRGALRRDGGGVHQYVDPTNLLFRSGQSAQQVLNTLQDSALACLITMQGNISSTNAMRRFGNFVDLQWVMNERLSQAALSAYTAADQPEDKLSSPVADFRNLLQRFEEEQFDPAWARTVEYTLGEGNPGTADLFAMLSRPMMTTDEWRIGIERIKAEPFECYKSDNTNSRLSELLCPNSLSKENANTTAAEMLSRPVLADVVVDIAHWVLVMSQLADQRIGGKWLSQNEIFELALLNKLPEGESTGELLVEKSIGVVDLAIASYAMIYGPFMADLVLEDFDSGENVKPVLNGTQTTGGNSFLASNVAQLFLERRYAERFPDESRSRPSKLSYRTAYNLALKNHPGRFLMLEALFGRDLNFAEGPKGAPVFFIGTDAHKTTLEVPPPAEMDQGRVAWPPRYYELLASREQLMDRLIGYEILDGLPGDQAEYMVVKMSEQAGLRRNGNPNPGAPE